MARNDERLLRDGLDAFATAEPNTTSKSVTRQAINELNAMASVTADDRNVQITDLLTEIQRYLSEDIFGSGAKAGDFVDFLIEHTFKIVQHAGEPTEVANALLAACANRDNTIRTSKTYSNFKYRESLRKLIQLFGSLATYCPDALAAIQENLEHHINRKAKNDESLNALLNGFIAAQAPPDAPSTSLLDRVAATVRRNTTQPTLTLTAQEARHPHSVLDALLTALNNTSLEHDLTKAYCASLKAFLNTPNVGTVEHYARGLFVITCTFLRESFNTGHTTDGLFDTLMEFIPKLMDFGADSNLFTDCIHFLLSDESNLPACSQTTLEQLAILISATADYYPEDTAYDLKAQYANRINNILTRLESADEAEVRINLPAPHARAFLALQRCEGKIARRSNTEQRHRRHFQRLVREGENSEADLLEAFIAYCREFRERGKDCREVFATLSEYLPPIIAAGDEHNTPGNIRNLIQFLLNEFIQSLVDEHYALEGKTLPHNVQATIQLLANVLLHAKLNNRNSNVLQNVAACARRAQIYINPTQEVSTAPLTADNKDYLTVLHALAFHLFEGTRIRSVASVCFNALLLANETNIEEILSAKLTYVENKRSLLYSIMQNTGWRSQNHDAFTRILIDLLERVLPANPNIKVMLEPLTELVTGRHSFSAMIEALCVCVPGLASAFNLETLFPRGDASTNMLTDLALTLRSRFRREDHAVRPINLLMLLIQQKRENPAAFGEFEALGGLLAASEGLLSFPEAYETLHDLILDSFDAEDSNNETVTLLQGLYHAMHRYVKEENHHRSKRITKKLFNFMQVAFLITTHNNHRLPLVLRLMNGYMIDLFTLPNTEVASFKHPGGMYRLCLHWMQTLLPHGDAEDQAAVRDTWHNAEDATRGLPLILNAYTYDQVNEGEHTVLSFDALAQYMGMLFPSHDDAQDNAVYQAVRGRNQDLVRLDSEFEVHPLMIPVSTIDAYFTPPVASTPWYSGLFGGGASDDGDDVDTGPARRLSFGGSGDG